MSDPNHLPDPDSDALEHSARLCRHIRRRIAEAGGWIDFSEYMELALYAPGLGYYSAGAQKFGESGDFVTAPEISPLFARCVARAFLDTEFGGGRGPPTILELGAGTGAMAVGIIETLQRLDAAPDRYLILEVSADLRERQRRFITERIPDLAARVAWLDELPPEPLTGVIVANEVLDALPVTRFAFDEPNAIGVLGVEACESGFRWRHRAAGVDVRERVSGIAASLGAKWPAGYTSEISTATHGFVGGLAQSLERGLIMLVDYGLSMRSYYDPERRSGTLACHYRHRMHADPFWYPGLQDITAWVDFSSVADASSQAGLDVLGFTTQAQFLLAGGVDEEYALLMESPPVAKDSRAQIRLAAGLKTLMMPGQMGENFKVMALGRGLERGPASVCENDLLHTL